MFVRRQPSDRGEGPNMKSVIIPSNGISLDICTPSANGVPLKEFYTSEDEHAPKVRKPYTITKQRERWTDEEHHKFLEALKLYGRAWRRIEEHIGSKTAVQIRSHAQKFFSKVVRESVSSRGGSIEIPPPRPKRKPMHPYPRKCVNSSKKEISVSEQMDRSPSPISSVSEQENRSPTSVLCTVVSDAMGSSVSNPPNTCSSPASSAEDNRFPSPTISAEEENGSPSPTPVNAVSSPHDKSSMKSDSGSKDHASTKESSSLEMPMTTLKLFGRTVLVTDSHRPSSCSTLGSIQQSHKQSPIVDDKRHHENLDLDAQNPLQTSPRNDATIRNFSRGQHEGNQNLPWPCGVLPPVFNCLQFQQQNSTSMEATTSVPWWAFYGNLPFLFVHPHSLNSTEVHSDCNNIEAFNEKEMQREGSWTGSNTDSVSEVGKGDKSGDVESRSGEPSEMDSVPAFHLRVSENSAFSSPQSRSMNCSKGFVPYKRCLAERDVQELQIGGDVREGKRVKLFL